MFDLSGRTALVTGATGGIGGEIARALKAQGAKVAISGTREDKLTALAAELGGDMPTLPCDLKNREAVGALIGQAEAALGGLDILVNNAGITRDNLFMRMKDEEWDDVIAVNLTSTFILCRAASRQMLRKRFGRIINIASISGVVGNPGQGNYAASKAGMVGMTKSLAREVAQRGVTANCIAPGFIETPMTHALNEKQVGAIAAAIPAGVFGKPEDISAAVVYLASNEARYVTGETIHVNGGMAMM
jgi:3-oxoacyl-[acyl-carrier protein] reductase